MAYRNPYPSIYICLIECHTCYIIGKNNMLTVYLLGNFEVDYDGNPVAIPSRPSQSLFAYLILSAGSSHRREKLTAWPASCTLPVCSHQNALLDFRVLSRAAAPSYDGVLVLPAASTEI